MGVTVPEGYKQTKVGVIPEEWKVVRLGDVLMEKPKYGINAPAVEYSETLPTYLRITDIDENGIFNTDKKVSVNDKNYCKYILQENDIVFARTGATVGKSYLYNANDGELVYAGFLIKVTPNPKKLNSVFLKNYTTTNRYWAWIQIMSARSGQPGVNGEEYSLMPIPLPPLKEQQKIAQILTTWDEAISKQEALIAEKEQLKKGLMQRLLSGEVRFEGFDGEWEEVRLEDLALKMQSGGTPKATNKNFYTGNIPFVKVNDITISGKYLIDTKVHITDEALKSSSAWIVPENSIIYSMYASVGFVTINKVKVSTSQAMINIIPKIEKIDVEYLYYYLLEFKKYIHRFIETGTQGNLNAQIVKKLPIKIPSLKEQQKIAQVLTTADKEIELLKKELEILKEQKRGLMQKLLTGEVRVKT